MKCHVFRRSRRVEGKRVRAKTYTGRYRLDGDAKDTEVALGISDKQAAKAELVRIAQQAERERQGVAVPSRQVETVSAPLKVLVREWVNDLAAKGRKPEYCATMELLLGVMMRECPWTTVKDIQPESFIRWRGRNLKKSPKTLNEYLGSARAFLNWLVKADRLTHNPLASVEKVETRGREVRRRRSLSHSEFLRLVEVADECRSIVYAVAYYTGLRRSEIASLVWEDIDLEAGSVRIRAENAKNKTTSLLPLHPDLQEALVRHREASGNPAPERKAFVVPPRLRAFDRDLKAAGIPKRDDQGRVLDFHCLRHSCATRLASENVPLPVAMRIMRHSDPKLTAKAYVDQGALPLAESIAKLPGMPKSEGWSPDSSLATGATGQNLSKPVATETNNLCAESLVFEAFRRALSRLVTTGEMAPALGIEPRT